MTRVLSFVVVASLFCVAAWLGAPPAHSDSMSSMRARSVVYPPSPGGLVMSHATPAHAKLPCTQCHADALTSTQVAQSLLPREQACTACHAERMDRTAATPQCAYCHRGFDAKQQPAIAPSRASAAHVTFSHAKHLRAGAKCAQCHATGGATPSLPTMDSCMACHTGERALPCNGCHVAFPSGRLRTKLPEGKLVPRGPFLGMAHDADFIVRHRWLAADEGAACKSCHVEKDCTDCHDGRVRPRSLHPNDYLSLHAQDALRNATQCSSCHTTQSFCLPCHARLGVSTLSGPDLAAPKRLHPPTAVWLRGPNLHAREAERSMTSCVSCHAERDCVHCHGSKGIGGAGHSPHPPGFRGECAARLANGDRACRQCHGDLSALRAMCR
jgi:Cytochrome c7 and related cytochrome c